MVRNCKSRMSLMGFPLFFFFYVLWLTWDSSKSQSNNSKRLWSSWPNIKFTKRIATSEIVYKFTDSFVLVITCLRRKFEINLLSSPFWNLPSETREISKFWKMKGLNFTQISRINMLFLVNHMWQAVKEHTSARITQKTISQYQQI